MGTDWANLTVESSGDAPPMASATQPDPRERVWTHLEAVFGEDAILPRDVPTVQTSQAAAREAARDVFDECPAAERALVVSISDSTHAGHGELYDETGKVDEWSGYEGANGADVVGWFEEEHGISGSYADPW